jgi:hypothetical protein
MVCEEQTIFTRKTSTDNHQTSKPLPGINQAYCDHLTLLSRNTTKSSSQQSNFPVAVKQYAMKEY